mgnify:CR=1 FL=1
MTKQVLIIEDDAFLQGLVVRKLSSSDFTVQAAGQWADAAIALKTFSPDIFIVDLVLPGGMDGFAIIGEIRKMTQFTQTPIIIFSNLSDEKDQAKAESLGASLFMVKSNFTLDELVEKVNVLIK